MPIAEREADQEPVEFGASAREIIDGMIAAKFLNPKAIGHPGSGASNGDGS